MYVYMFPYTACLADFPSLVAEGHSVSLIGLTVLRIPSGTRHISVHVPWPISMGRIPMGRQNLQPTDLELCAQPFRSEAGKMAGGAYLRSW